MLHEKIQALTPIQQPSRNSLLDRLREEVLEERPSPGAIRIDKSPELLEMERLLKRVYNVLMQTNQYLKRDWSAEEVKFIIEDHAVVFLKNFGLDLCKYVSEPIVNLTSAKFTSHSNFLTFNELCKIEKRWRDEFEKRKEINQTEYTRDEELARNNIEWMKNQLPIVFRRLNENIGE